MVRAVTIDLITPNPAAHGVFETATETARTVFAEVRSVGMTEFYRAHEAGIEPTIVFRLADYSDYNGEKTVAYNGARYRVIRTYVSGQTIEITCEEATVDA